MFTTTAEELSEQLGILEGGSKSGGPAERPAPLQKSAGPSLLQRAAAAAPSPALQAYLARGGAPAATRRSLAEQIDDNLRLLRILAEELRELLARMQPLYEQAQQQALAAGGGGSSAPGHGDPALLEDEGDDAASAALAMAAALDGLEQQAGMLVS